MWKIFIDLHNCRGNNGYGINPIGYQDLYAYSRVHKIDFEDWEITLIKMFDSVVLELTAKQQEAEAKKAQSKAK